MFDGFFFGSLCLRCFVQGWTYTIWAGLMVLSGSLILWVAWKGQAWREKAIERETKAAATAENQAETPTITTTTPTPTTTVVTESEKLQILNEQDGSKKEIIRKEVTIS